MGITCIDFRGAHLIVLVVECPSPLLCKTNHNSPVAIVKGSLKLEVDTVFKVGSLLPIHECQASRHFPAPTDWNGLNKWENVRLRWEIPADCWRGSNWKWDVCGGAGGSVAGEACATSLKWHRVRYKYGYVQMSIWRWLSFCLSFWDFVINFVDIMSQVSLWKLA